MEGVKLKIYNKQQLSKLGIPFFENTIPAGFPSPADDYTEQTLDLNEHLVKNPSSTFFARVSGLSMINSGINDGDLIIVDKSLTPKNNSVLVCSIDGEFTLKRFKKAGQESGYLLPDNQNFEPIKVNINNSFVIWGVVTHSIHNYF